jgi:hypothetical protein
VLPKWWSFIKQFSQIWLHTRLYGSRNQKNHSIFLATYWNLCIKIGRLGKKNSISFFQNARCICLLSMFLPSFSLCVRVWSVPATKIVFRSLRFPVFLDFLINVEPAFSWRYEALFWLVFSLRASSKFCFHRSQFLVSVSLVDNEVCLFASLFEYIYFFPLQFCLCVFSCPLWSVLCFCTCCSGSVGYVVWPVNPFWTYFWRYFCVCMCVYLHGWFAYFFLKPLSKAPSGLVLESLHPVLSFLLGMGLLVYLF